MIHTAPKLDKQTKWKIPRRKNLEFTRSDEPKSGPSIENHLAELSDSSSDEGKSKSEGQHTIFNTRILQRNFNQTVCCLNCGPSGVKLVQKT